MKGVGLELCLLLPDGCHGRQLGLVELVLVAGGLHVVVALPLRTLLLLPLQLLQLLHDVRIHKVGNVVPVHDLGDDVVLPLGALEVVQLLQVWLEDPGASPLEHEVLLCPSLGQRRPGRHGCLLRLYARRDDGWPSHGVSRLGDGGFKTRLDGSHGCGLALLLPDTLLEQLVTRGRLDRHDAFLGECAHLEEHGTAVQHTLDELAIFSTEVGEATKVGLVDDDDERLALKQRPNVAEQADLLLDGEAARLGDVQEVENGRTEMREGCNSLHLDGVSVLKIVVQNPRCVDHLPRQVLVIHVTNKEGLGGEGVVLHVDVCAGDLVHEARLADVGVSAHQ
mmetsp:Transcript_50561/g.109932  ORF Transcript_50561/g.109932 Transcript_50561/m.109932 type:complete len:337 (-) Transcript_50561:508-1518(-)